VNHTIIAAHAVPDLTEWKLVNEADTALTKQSEKEKNKHFNLLCVRCRETIYFPNALTHLKIELVSVRFL
jgi:hypothetical protein